MIQLKQPKEVERLRRLALAAQGLLQAEPYGRGLEGARKAIAHIGYVQIDSISVVERAHHHVLYSRVPNYKPAMLDTLLRDKNIFEYWVHAAAFLPIEDFRFSLPYKQAIKNGQVHWYKNPDQTLMAELLARIKVDGPLRSRDIENNTSNRSGWWDWKPAKKALEQLYMQGDLMVSCREGFQKTYDLTERVLPSQVNKKMPSVQEFAEHIIEQQLHSHGVMSHKGFTYLRRNSELRKAVKVLINEMLVEQRLEEIQLSSGEVFIAEAGALDYRLPRMSNRLLILSPFDNSVIQRERLKALFQYNYQIECYVPVAKRVYGYFCLPLLFKSEYVGRMDCKVDRKNRHLLVKALYFEPHHFDEDMIVMAWVKAVKLFCVFQQCDSVSLDKVEPKSVGQKLHTALKDVY